MTQTDSTSATSKILRASKYGWAMPGDSGRFSSIAIDALKVDASYQRPEVSISNTRSKASGFSWAAFGTLIVMERDTAELFVVDGYQRLLAARLRGDITHVPCLVFRSTGREHEAAAFRHINTNRVSVSSVRKFYAGSMAGIEPECSIHQWLTSLGLVVTEDGTARDEVAFPAHLIRTWKLSDQSTRNAIAAQLQTNAGEPLHFQLHRGLFWLFYNGVNVFNEVTKLRILGGRTAMLSSIKAMQIQCGHAAASDKLCGSALLHMINKGRRNRTTVDSE